MQDERLPKLACNSNQWENKVEAIPKRDRETSFWQRVEYRINKPNQHLKKKKHLGFGYSDGYKLLIMNSDFVVAHLMFLHAVHPVRVYGNKYLFFSFRRNLGKSEPHIKIHLARLHKNGGLKVPVGKDS
jgi:hypothetical protein